MNTLQILKTARTLIEKPENFTATALAVDKNGEQVGVSSDKAVAFCTIGALLKISPFGYSDAFDALQGQLGDGRGWSLIQFTENNPHEKVLGLFDLAIKAELNCES